MPQDDNNTIYIPNIPLLHLGNHCDYAKDLVTSGISTTKDLFILFDTYGIADLHEAYEFANDTTKKILLLLAIMQDRNRWNELLSMVIGNNEKLWSIVPIQRNSNSIRMFANKTNHQLNDILKIIQKFYIENIVALSVRAHNVIKSIMPNFSDLIIYTLLYGTRFKHFKNCGISTWNEINSFASKFRFDMSKITNSLYDEPSICLHRLSYYCSSEKEEQFISEFYKMNGHLPMFNILSSYLCKSENRFERFYRSAYGIQCDSLHYTQIAKQNGISYERVRQIISKGDIGNKSLVEIEH